jgi:lipopolysaccharide/colanic/teichoic acid biosynthesis glycosyltransferase
MKRQDDLRRILNIGAASVLLILTLPLMVVIALVIRLTSRGPVIFTQPRVGVDRRRGRPSADVLEKRKVDHGGRIFQIYKFRTMQDSHDSRSRQVWAGKDDPRITPVGRFLRAYRLDELPQLVNVLKGDMNLVGPRPEQPEIFSRLRADLPAYAHRQRVLPGITGWAQVNRGYDNSLDDVKRKLDYDLEYLERRSAAQDLMIMARTAPVMVFRQGSQ